MVARVGRVAKVARYRDVDRQVWLQGLQALQRLRGTETLTDRYGCKGCKGWKGCKGCELQGQIDRQVWAQGLQRSRDAETYRQTGMVARVALFPRTSTW